MNFEYEIGSAQKLKIAILDLKSINLFNLDLGLISAGQHSTILDISSLNAGMYMIHLEGEKGRLVGKLIVN